MADPQGLIFYNNDPWRVRSASFTLTPGTTPSSGSIEIARLDSYPPARGDLSLVYGTVQIQLKNCRCDYVSSGTGADGETVWRLMILDRRDDWKKRGLIHGHYNVTAPLKTPNPAETRDIDSYTERTPRELVSLCLDALGEVGYDVSLVPNDARPEVEWSNTLPVNALQDLLNTLKCVCCLGPSDNKIYIVPVGYTTVFFDTDDVTSHDSMVDPPNPPPRLCIVAAKTKIQHSFRLEMVLPDLDGTWKSAELVRYALDRFKTSQEKTKTGQLIDIRTHSKWFCDDAKTLSPHMTFFWGDDSAKTLVDRHVAKIIRKYLFKVYRIMPYSSVADYEATFNGTEVTIRRGGYAWAFTPKVGDRIAFHALPVVRYAPDGSSYATITRDEDIGVLPKPLVKSRPYYVNNVLYTNSSESVFEISETIDGPTLSMGGSTKPEENGWGKFLAGSAITGTDQLITSIQDVEILDSMVETEYGDDLIIRPKPAKVFGLFANAPDAETAAQAFIDDPFAVENFVTGDGTTKAAVYDGGFSIDSDRGFVMFSSPIYKWMNYEREPSGASSKVLSTGVEPCTNLFLRTACHIRDKNKQWVSYQFGNDNEFGNNPKLPSHQVEHVVREDIERLIYVSNSDGSLQDNADECKKLAQYYWNQEAQQYQQKDALTVDYVGFRLVGNDGQVMQVTWNVGRDGIATTRVSRGRDEIKLSATYRERLELEKRKAVAYQADQQKWEQTRVARASSNQRKASGSSGG